ncbi:hypothetical protein [Marivita geojedonensis]|uniref:Uncharacterized protein n=1 Tax=Marivita geojedonensis TaxID=1123756 RepID=A0A1X4NLS4_9RHOB|nr:hypothetical protein [Marivita geojedonensis]OSQ51261.1 hypothetical protein MGEO_09400 [Marivita geojedonensis]PRY78466.1 hypothetical protein CLV76_10623 [Marivita geojedonensis]
MRNVIRIGVVSQPELPKQLEPMIEAIFREQFKKLLSIVGSKNIALVSSVECKVRELACISAVEEGLTLELEPFETPGEGVEEEAEIMAKIHAILEKQPGTTELKERVPEMALTKFCDIMFLVFDKSLPDQSSRLEELHRIFFANKATGVSLGKLIIDVNCPKRWSADADGEVYFDYVTRASGQLAVSSEVEIPNQLIKEWKDIVSSSPH